MSPKLKCHQNCNHSPLIILQLHARITVHAQTAAWPRSTENSESSMSGKCGESRDQFIMTSSPIHLGNRSRLGERHGPWLTHLITQSLTESLTHSSSTEDTGAGAVCCQFTLRHCMQIVRMFNPWNFTQPPRVGSALFRMQGAEGCVMLPKQKCP